MDFKKPSDLKLNYYELLITENCNSKCSYCFGSYAPTSPCDTNTWAQPELIPDIINFIDKTKNGERITIHYIGGEPLLNFDFMKLSADEFNSKYSPNLEYSINTNIVSLDEEKINFLVKNKFGITTSIDGLQKSHDKNRGNWKNVMQNLVLLNSAYIDAYGANHGKIGAVYVVDADDDNIFEGYSFLRDLGIMVTLSLNHEGGWNDEKLDFYKSELKKIVRKYPIDSVSPFNRYIRNLESDKKNFCVRHDSNVTISPLGKLFFCHRLTPKYKDMPEGYEYSFGDIWNGYSNESYYKTVGDVVNNFTKYSECENCEDRQLCLGGCLGVQFSVNNDHSRINPLVCKLMKIRKELLKEQGIYDKPTTC